MQSIVGLKELRENINTYINAVKKGRSFIVVKNIEEYSRHLIEKVVSYDNLVLSGDFDLFKYTDILPGAKTRVMFSSVNLPEFSQKFPALDKYEGLLVSKDLSGKVSLTVDEG